MSEMPSPDSKKALVHIDPAVMGGRPVFVGTHVPIDVVLTSIDAGEASARLKAVYPFMTRGHIDAAMEWIECNGITPRSQTPLRRAASENESALTSPRWSPLHMQEVFSQAAKRRRSLALSLQQEPKLRCEIRVQDRSEEEIVGVLTTFSRRDNDTLCVMCHWQGEERETFPTLLDVHQAASPWDQIFLYALALTGDFSVEAFPSLATGRWHTASLQMPDVDGTDVDAKVTVNVDADSWVAALTSTRTARPAAKVEVPEELHQQDVGTLLVEMSSRLLLGRSGWAA